jgi:hypothetical protein
MTKRRNKDQQNKSPKSRSKAPKRETPVVEVTQRPEDAPPSKTIPVLLKVGPDEPSEPIRVRYKRGPDEPSEPIRVRYKRGPDEPPKTIFVRTTQSQADSPPSKPRVAEMPAVKPPIKKARDKVRRPRRER